MQKEAKARIKIKKIEVKDLAIITFEKNTFDFISLTDIAKYRDRERTNYIVQNWMRTRSTVEFLGLWEKLHNAKFNSIEFDALNGILWNAAYL